jgi:hypothetical protein
MSLTFAVQLPDGTVEQHQITPGGKIRLAVGERDGPHGAVWTILATKNEPSLYIVLRQLGALQKWSFHGTGDWRYQWVDSEQAEARARELGHEGGRVLDQWPQPPEVGETGWTSAFSIRIRHQDLERHDDSLLPKDIYWVPPPPEGAARQVHVAILRPTATVIDLKGMVPLCGFGLADNRHVLTLGSTHTVTDDLNFKIAEWTDEGRRQLLARGVEADESARMAVHSVLDDGHRVAWDLAFRH